MRWSGEDSVANEGSKIDIKRCDSKAYDMAPQKVAELGTQNKVDHWAQPRWEPSDLQTCEH